jgi:hypothetical protein
MKAAGSRAALDAVFRATVYRALLPDGPVDLCIGHSCAPLDRWLAANDAECWAFVTACNPGSRALDEMENRQRHEALRERVRRGGWIAVEGEGIPQGSDWRAERSLLIAGIRRRDALALGRAFDQLAIVAGRRGRPARLCWLDEDRQQ